MKSTMETSTETMILEELRAVRTEVHDVKAELKEINKRLDNTNDRVSTLEKGRIEDRRDILVVLDTIQKSISEQFAEMKEYMDEKFEKIFALQRVNDNEHDKFKELLCNHNKRLDFHNARITNLEDWKQDFDMGEYTAV